MDDNSIKDDKLINSIKRYVKHNYIGALLLSGDWGTGKTFFVENHLIPELNKSKIKNIFVSLYGINSIYDLSKNLYFELLTSKFNSFKKNKFFKKAKPYLKYTGKTILKNIFRHFNVDFSTNKKDFDAFFKSFDLKNTLIILDDLERSSIDINELFGLINSLVEKENLKLLLVGNEKEIEKNEKYYALKSKTICNTLEFKCKLKDTIINIISNFPCVSKIDIQVLMKLLFINKYDGNLRDFHFCCAKAQEFAEEINKFIIKTTNEIMQDFIKFVFFGILSIVLSDEYKSKIHKGEIKELSEKLFGTIINYNTINITHPFVDVVSNDSTVSIPIFTKFLIFYLVNL